MTHYSLYADNISDSTNNFHRNTNEAKKEKVQVPVKGLPL